MHERVNRVNKTVAQMAMCVRRVATGRLVYPGNLRDNGRNDVRTYESRQRTFARAL